MITKSNGQRNEEIVYPCMTTNFSAAVGHLLHFISDDDQFHCWVIL